MISVAKWLPPYEQVRMTMYWKGHGLKSSFFTSRVEINIPFVDYVNLVLAWLAPADWYNFLLIELQILHKGRNISTFYQWYTSR